MTVDGRSSLFTGDAGIFALEEVADLLEEIGFGFSSLKFIQVPHHGSKRNVGPKILDRIIGPKQKEDVKLMSAFVSASENGEPKHPAKKVMNAFRRRGAPVFATQGGTKWHYSEAPERTGWSTAEPLPFYDEVEE